MKEKPRLSTIEKLRKVFELLGEALSIIDDIQPIVKSPVCDQLCDIGEDIDSTLTKLSKLGNLTAEVEETKVEETKVEETTDTVEYLKSIEWSIGCGGDRNEGQCPECYGPSKEWAEKTNKNWVQQFGHKRVEIGHTPECKLGNALKRSVPMYAIGQDDGEGGCGMWDGPNSSLSKMLEVIGRDTNSVIIRFNVDGSDEEIYRWHSEWKQWNQQRELDVKEL